MEIIVLHFYRSARKLRGSNDFSRICLSVHGMQGTHVTVTHDVLDLAVQHTRLATPPLDTGPHLYRSTPY